MSERQIDLRQVLELGDYDLVKIIVLNALIKFTAKSSALS